MTYWIDDETGMIVGGKERSNEVRVQILASRGFSLVLVDHAAQPVAPPDRAAAYGTR